MANKNPLKLLVHGLAVAIASFSLCSLTFVSLVPDAPRAKKMTNVEAAPSFPSPEAVSDAEVSFQDSLTSPMHASLRFVAAIAAAVLVALVPLQSAEAARSGGRMGGSSSFFRSRPMPRPTMPKSSFNAASSARAGVAMPRPGIGATVSRPNISIGVSPIIAPPVFGSPFGFGFGGFGLFGPPILPIPVPSGPSASDQVLQNQQAQDERQIDEQKSEIQELKKQIEELKTKQR
jgi:hypothetical protein